VRQQLFLQRLSKATPAGHADFDALKRAEKRWISILEECNIVAGASAVSRRTAEIASLLDGAPATCAVTAAGRKLTHEGSLTKIGNATVRPDYFFLFETLSATELLHTPGGRVRPRTPGKMSMTEEGAPGRCGDALEHWIRKEAFV